MTMKLEGVVNLMIDPLPTHPQPCFISSSLRAVADFSLKPEPGLLIESIEELKRIELVLRERLGRDVLLHDVLEYVRVEQQH